MKVNLILNHIIKILLVSLLCIMLLIGSIFVIPPHFAFAEDSAFLAIPNTDSDFTGQSNATIKNAIIDQGVMFGTYGTDLYGYILNYSDLDLGLFCVSNVLYVTSFESPLDTKLYSAYSGRTAPSSSNYDSSQTNQVQLFDDKYYYATFTPYYTMTENYCPVYDSLDLAFEAISSSSGGSGGSVEPKQAIITIEPGYVAYIGVTGGNAIFTATFNKKQPSGSINSNIRYAFSSSRPPESSTITMDSSVGNMIPFVADRPFDIWGKSYNGRYGMADLSASYLIVYVPLTDPDGNTNATVKVALSQYLNSVQFPLSASMVGGDIVSTGNSDEFYISDSSMLNDDFRPEYVYSNGGTTSTAISIPVGGNNLPPTTGGGSLIEQFTSLLSDLINRIESLLIAPVEYIKWIISSSSNFMAWLSAIWTWLPEPVYTTIVSVLLILVVVGALKLLWR